MFAESGSECAIVDTFTKSPKSQKSPNAFGSTEVHGDLGDLVDFGVAQEKNE